MIQLSHTQQSFCEFILFSMTISRLPMESEDEIENHERVRFLLEVLHAHVHILCKDKAALSTAYWFPFGDVTGDCVGCLFMILIGATCTCSRNFLGCTLCTFRPGSPHILLLEHQTQRNTHGQTSLRHLSRHICENIPKPPNWTADPTRCMARVYNT